MVKDLRYRPLASAITKPPPQGAPSRFSLRDALLDLLEPAEQADLIKLEPKAAANLYTALSLNREKQRYLELCNKAWDVLLPRLWSGECIGTGCAPGDPFAPHRAIPARRWAYANPNYKHWTVTIGNVELIEIEISTVGGLHVYKSLRQARLGTVTFKLGTNISLFLTLVDGAKSGRTLEPVEELKQKHFSASTDPKVVGQGIFKIRQQMIRAGVNKETADNLITNETGGYRLNMPSAEITIED